MCWNNIRVYGCNHYDACTVKFCKELFKTCLGPKAVDPSNPFTTNIEDKLAEDCHEWYVSAFPRSLSDA